MGAAGIPGAISRYTPTRDRIYRVLLGAPHDEWTVSALATAAGPGISTSAARDTIYTLIAAAAMTIVPGHRAVTVQLTATGLTQLQSVEQAWQIRRPVTRTQPQPSSPQHRNQRRPTPRQD
jgi:hypothetical protein